MNGVKGLGTGVVSGITGIITQPIQGAYNEGFTGLIKGVGVGMIGAVAKPLSSAMDLVAQTSESILTTTVGMIILLLVCCIPILIFR